MSVNTSMHFKDLSVQGEPFPHFVCPVVFSPEFESSVQNWLNNAHEWTLTQTDFYSQYEFSVMHASLPGQLCYLTSSEAIEAVAETFRKTLKAKPLHLTEITAHKLVQGHRMGVHNDYIDGEETHRLVIQINNGWKEHQGGYLMLFRSGNAQDVSKIISPVSNTAFGFEISNRSFHAVSTVQDFLRYTLVYTFKEE